jgi:hypothetical protein
MDYLQRGILIEPAESMLKSENGISVQNYLKRYFCSDEVQILKCYDCFWWNFDTKKTDIIKIFISCFLERADIYYCSHKDKKLVKILSRQLSSEFGIRCFVTRLEHCPADYDMFSDDKTYIESGILPLGDSWLNNFITNKTPWLFRIFRKR